MKKNLRWKKNTKKKNPAPFYKNLSQLETHTGRGSVCIIGFSVSACFICVYLIWAFSFKYRASCVCVQVSHVQLLAAPRTVVWQAPLSMEFSRQEYWSGLQHSLPGDLPKPRDYTSISYVSCLGRWIYYHQHHLGNPSRLQCQVTS